MEERHGSVSGAEGPLGEGPEDRGVVCVCDGVFTLDQISILAKIEEMRQSHTGGASCCRFAWSCSCTSRLRPLPAVRSCGHAYWRGPGQLG